MKADKSDKVQIQHSVECFRVMSSPSDLNKTSQSILFTTRYNAKTHTIKHDENLCICVWQFTKIHSDHLRQSWFGGTYDSRTTHIIFNMLKNGLVIDWFMWCFFAIFVIQLPIVHFSFFMEQICRKKFQKKCPTTNRVELIR